MALAIEMATAKTHKYAVRASGDTVEVVERPGGGLSMVMVDGQGSGEGAKTLSLMLTARAVAMLKEGVRDGAVARAVHDTLFAFRQGKVSSSLDIISADLMTRTAVATRNTTTPLIVGEHGSLLSVPDSAGPIGRYSFTRPVVSQFDLADGLTLIAYSDGIADAGGRSGAGFNVHRYLEAQHLLGCSAQEIADSILAEAVALDHGRPRDDLTVIAMTVRQHAEEPLIRRLAVRVPLP